MSKRILHLIHTPRHSGAETLVRELCLIHQTQGIETAIASFAPSDPDFMPSIQRLKQAGVKVYFPDKRLTGFNRVQFFKKAYHDFKPHLVYGHSVLPALYGRLALPLWGQKPAFVSVLHSATNDDYSDIKLWGCELLLTKRSKHVFAVSQEGAQNYKKRIPFSPTVHVVSNGADLSQIRIANKSRPEHRARHGLLPTDQIILQVGRLSSTKQQLLTLEAMATTLKSNPNLKLWFAGLTQDESYEQSIRNMISDLGFENQVLLLGSRDDVPALLSACDLYVMPSLMEAHSVAVIEALASGIPVVASNIPTLQWSSSFDGVVLVAPQDSFALAEAAKHLLSLRQRYERNLSEYDIAVTANKYSAPLYEDENRPL